MNLEGIRLSETVQKRKTNTQPLPHQKKKEKTHGYREQTGICQRWSVGYSWNEWRESKGKNSHYKICHGDVAFSMVLIIAFSVLGISQTRILEQIATSYYRGSSWPRGRSHVSHFLYWQADSLPLCHVGSSVIINNTVLYVWKLLKE